MQRVKEGKKPYFLKKGNYFICDKKNYEAFFFFFTYHIYIYFIYEKKKILRRIYTNYPFYLYEYFIFSMSFLFL